MAMVRTRPASRTPSRDTRYPVATPTGLHSTIRASESMATAPRPEGERGMEGLAEAAGAPARTEVTNAAPTTSALRAIAVRELPRYPTLRPRAPLVDNTLAPSPPRPTSRP